MIFTNLEDFLKTISKNKRLIALDVGRKNIGVAISDKSWMLSTPKTTIIRKSNKIDIPQIINLYNENNACALIIGLPLNNNGEETGCSKYVKNFTNAILEQKDIPVFFINEAYTSAESEELLIDEIGLSFKKTKTIVDKMSACFILNDFFSQIKNH
jgi:putative Holliday junction resolvase